MPPENNGGPPCPACYSIDTERMPFGAAFPKLPIYACNQCDHVWTQQQSRPAPGANEGGVINADE